VLCQGRRRGAEGEKGEQDKLLHGAFSAGVEEV
jgi:hypothetical protein